MSQKNSWIIGVIVVVLFVGFIVAIKQIGNNKPSPLNAFAQCLKDAKATMYGAFWCPHCQAQKKLFGNAAKLLPYVECSTPDTKSQTQICIDKKIEGYPVWEYADGTRTSGEQTLEQLAAKTSCKLPTL